MNSSCSCCNVAYEFCELIECLIQDIQHLETETVKARYKLSQHLTPPHDENVRNEILSDLASSYYEYPAYGIYLALMHSNENPMESDEYVKHLLNTAKGRTVSSQY
ncbi:hypothetical protein T472_0200775 [Youngiibacter fragilis 232.1]|uniref:Uncharacterized protein n=1 Tax=Youngiibacter fragilis 232.1 TaxID=994573 RepID=V7ICA6_9CLOT|nr:hypothetical protein T472_0200775 [Youngiibacter fragilis 232.1]